jgi:hypothetical protein
MPSFEQPRMIDAILRDWHPRSREIAIALAQRYGPPVESSATRITWGPIGLWRSTVVHRDAVLHAWPEPHDDVLEQTLDHHVPLDRVESLLAFHGGLCVHRTRGELSVCCASEAVNACAMNLAHELARSRITLTLARRLFADRFPVLASRPDVDAHAELVFARQSATADPDEPTTRASSL